MSLFDNINLDEVIDVTTNDYIIPKENKDTVEPTNKENNNKEDEDLIEIIEAGDSTDEIDKIIESVSTNKKPVEITNEKKVTETTPSNNETPDSSPIKLFAKVLFEEGVLSELNEEEFDSTDDKIDVLINSIKKEVTKAIEVSEEVYPEKIKQILNAYKSGVPEEDILSYIQNEIDYTSITDEELQENEELQKALIKQDLTAKGYSSEEIEEEILDAETVDKLFLKSKRALKSVVAIQKKQFDEIAEAKKLERQQIQDRIKEQQDKTRTYLESSTEILPGIEINKAVKDKIFNSMYKPVAKDKNGNPVSALSAARSKDPVKFDTIFHYLLVNGVFEGKLDSLVKPVKTKAIKEFESVVKSDTTFKEGSQKVVKTKESNSTLNALREIFEK